MYILACWGDIHCDISTPVSCPSFPVISMSFSAHKKNRFKRQRVQFRWISSSLTHQRRKRKSQTSSVVWSSFRKKHSHYLNCYTSYSVQNQTLSRLLVPKQRPWHFRKLQAVSYEFSRYSGRRLEWQRLLWQLATVTVLAIPDSFSAIRVTLLKWLSVIVALLPIPEGVTVTADKWMKKTHRHAIQLSQLVAVGLWAWSVAYTPFTTWVFLPQWKSCSLGTLGDICFQRQRHT